MEMIPIVFFSTISLLCFYMFYVRKKRNGVTEYSDKRKPRSIDEDSDFRPNDVLIFYGSQTGTAEELSFQLLRMFSRNEARIHVMNVNEFMTVIHRLPFKPICIFILATYGNGEPTDNARKFYAYLKNHKGAVLDGLRYSVFGLGDSSYIFYNEFGKFVDVTLEKCGASRIHTLGLGDSSKSLLEDFMHWTNQLWSVLVSLNNWQVSGLNRSRIPLYRLETCVSKPENLFVGEIHRLGSYKHQKPPFGPNNPYLAKITSKQELFSDSTRSCLHIELDLSGAKMRYETGDHIAIYPRNDPAQVSRIGEILDQNLEEIVRVVSDNGALLKSTPFPSPCSFRTALSFYLDISQPPSPFLLSDLADYATNECDKEMLTTLGSQTPEGKDLYNQWIVKESRFLIDVLQHFKSLKPPLKILCQLLPPLKPRYYSIASASKCYPRCVHLTVIIISYMTSRSVLRNGVCTHFLNNCTVGDCIPIYVRKTNFRLPHLYKVPIICVAFGSGLAPIRSFIQHRRALSREGFKMGKITVYYGCRTPGEFLYKDDFHPSLLGDLTTIHVAFSREPPRIHVTDLIWRDRDAIWALIKKQGCYIYVAGDSKMVSKDVLNAFIEVGVKCGPMSLHDATFFFRELMKCGRYLQDA